MFLALVVLVVAFVGGVLVYRNNKAKGDAVIAAAQAKIDSLKK